jgi:hypothetical protein
MRKRWIPIGKFYVFDVDGRWFLTLWDGASDTRQNANQWQIGDTLGRMPMPLIAYAFMLEVFARSPIASHSALCDVAPETSPDRFVDSKELINRVYGEYCLPECDFLRRHCPTAMSGGTCQRTLAFSF